MANSITNSDTLATVLHALGTALNAVLSPLLALLNPICTAIGDLTYAALDPLPVWCSLTLLSAIAGFCALVVFRYTSNQKAIGRALDDIKANLLALKLYKDELRVTFQSQWRIMGAIARLQLHMLVPVVVMIGPMLLGLAQIGVRHQWRPLHASETTLITVRYDQETGSHPEIRLEPSPGLTVEVDGVPGGGKIVWRVRGKEPGRHRLQFSSGGKVVEKDLVVGDGFTRVSAARVGSDWIGQLFHPTEPILQPDSPIEAIEIAYPSVDSIIYGADWWVLYFFIVSMVTALIFKPLFNVRF